MHACCALSPRSEGSGGFKAEQNKKKIHHHIRKIAENNKPPN